VEVGQESGEALGGVVTLAVPAELLHLTALHHVHQHHLRPRSEGRGATCSIVSVELLCPRPHSRQQGAAAHLGQVLRGEAKVAQHAVLRRRHAHVQRLAAVALHAHVPTPTHMIEAPAVVMTDPKASLPQTRLTAADAVKAAMAAVDSSSASVSANSR